MHPKLPGLTRELICDLVDMIWKFGRSIPSVPQRFVTALRPEPMIAFSPVISPCNELSVFRGHDVLIETPMHTIYLQEGSGKDMILWDERVSIEDAQNFRQDVHERVKACYPEAFTDAGGRSYIPTELSARISQRSVEMVFANPSHKMFIPVRADPEDLLQQFDQPDLLECRQDPKHNRRFIALKVSVI